MFALCDVNFACYGLATFFVTNQRKQTQTLASNAVFFLGLMKLHIVSCAEGF
jgi:hypothetical protein